MKHILILSVLLAYQHLAVAQTPVYKDSSFSIQQRVDDLLQRMTPEEKFRQLFMVAGDLGTDSMRFSAGLFGFQINTEVQQANAANQLMQYRAGAGAYSTLLKINGMQRFFMEETRLGIPFIPFDEALHGLVRSGATAFPQSIGLAATFDTVLMNRVAQAIAVESRARGLRMILSPVVNVATDVRWGRVEETYGEDPFLVSLMGVAYVRNLEQSGIITTPKHFAVNHGDGGRDSYPVHYNERLLNELYFVPFRAVFEKGGARSVMTAYNSIDGRPCTASDWLLNRTLKQQWAFRGFVISDAAATGGANVLHFTATDYADAGKQSIESGLDVIFQTDFSSYDLFKAPFLNGEADAAAIDSAVSRVLRMKFELGLFDTPYTDTLLLHGIDPAAHREIAYEAAVKSVVLLKNDAGLLPLSGHLNKIAVIGADAAEARLGGYSGPGNQPVSILEGIREEWKGKADVVWSPGCDRTTEDWKIVEGTYLSHTESGQTIPGLHAAYFNNTTLEGDPVLTRTDAQIDFQWTLFSPAPAVQYDHFSVRWEGVLLAPVSGYSKIGIDGNDGYRLYIDNKLLIDTWSGQGYHTTLVPFRFQEGRHYTIRIEYKESAGNAWFRLIRDTGMAQVTEKRLDEAVRLARKSDVVILVAGIEEGEFRDRSSLHLPGKQEELIRRVAATGTPVVVVLIGGSAIITESWSSDVAAILDAWYPGEAGGTAVAAILSGKENPSGKLPVTFPKSEGQLPLVYNHKPTGRGDDYADGSGQPEFPFGFGLSYTSFAYSDLSFDQQTAAAGDTIRVSFVIRNTGDRAGEEVVQLYLHDEVASVARPVKELKGIRRVHLEAGAAQRITMEITPEMLQLLNEQLETVIEPGTFRVMIGSSSKDIRLRALIQIQ